MPGEVASNINLVQSTAVGRNLHTRLRKTRGLVLSASCFLLIQPTSPPSQRKKFFYQVDTEYQCTVITVHTITINKWLTSVAWFKRFSRCTRFSRSTLASPFLANLDTGCFLQVAGLLSCNCCKFETKNIHYKYVCIVFTHGRLSINRTRLPILLAVS